MARATTFRLSEECHLRLRILREVLDLSTSTAALQYAIGKTYDRLPEERAFLQEIQGGAKSPMSLAGVIKWARQVLSGEIELGRIHVSCGQPLFMNEDTDVKSLSLDIMRELGVVPSFFVLHTYYWGDRHRDIFLGPERARRISPTRSARDRGVPFSIHTDAPIVPMDTLLLMWSAVNRTTTGGAVLGPLGLPPPQE